METFIPTTSLTKENILTIKLINLLKPNDIYIYSIYMYIYIYVVPQR